MTSTRLRLLAAVAGAALGLAGRGVPVAIAAAIVRPPAAGPCGMEEVLECVVRDSGTIVAGVARLAAAAVAISGAAAVAGVAASVGGLMSRHRITSPLLVGGGVMLMAPAIWLAGSFLVFMWT